MLDKRYDPIIAKPTASDSGRNMAPAAPTMKRDGTNTASTQSIEISSGTATSRPESTTARATRWPVARCVWMFSITTVDISTSTPMASARPPSVMMLIVRPVSHSPMTAPMSASGMLATTINELRQSRRNKSTTMPVSSAPRAPSNVSPLIARVTYGD